MKITEYSATKRFTEDQVLLVDGNGGTKNIRIGDAVQAMFDFMSPINHRTIFRGKNLGSVITTEQKAAIQAGTFEDLWLGDYWKVGTIRWRIVDFDYWLGTGDTSMTKHHLVIMPDDSLGSFAMNDNGTTTGGYAGSNMYTTHLPSVLNDTISSVFGDVLISHPELLTNAVSNEVASGHAWFDAEVVLPNQFMMFGSRPINANGGGREQYANSNTQLAALRAFPDLITLRYSHWLRDVTSATTFAMVNANGGAGSDSASNRHGIRPVFAIG
ncbi:MAG: hypothetical protein IKY27_00115 [Bacteroidales bacterium]|nr:hypothetical protein [Bacteroidales bacterium]